MNRFFNFSSLQIKLLLGLVGLLLVGSVLEFVRSYATVKKDEFKFSVQIGDGDQSYRPVFSVDINLSPADSLELIPGIGPVLASRIVAYRDTIGRFEKPENIMAVHGIGFTKYEKIKPYLQVKTW
ncbi:MAG: helix-hairpin-helix domain-containing protein [candidate division Zixibacteria bacterium]|nr:helix-hairpin-helix domain-containing protein [candidate division Zixibacteria bacterium]